MSNVWSLNILLRTKQKSQVLDSWLLWICGSQCLLRLAVKYVTYPHQLHGPEPCQKMEKRIHLFRHTLFFWTLSCFNGSSMRQPAGAIMITGFFCLAVHKEAIKDMISASLMCHHLTNPWPSPIPCSGYRAFCYWVLSMWKTLSAAAQVGLNSL